MKYITSNFWVELGLQLSELNSVLSYIHHFVRSNYSKVIGVTYRVSLITTSYLCKDWVNAIHDLWVFLVKRNYKINDPWPQRATSQTYTEKRHIHGALREKDLQDDLQCKGESSRNLGHTCVESFKIFLVTNFHINLYNIMWMPSVQYVNFGTRAFFKAF